MYTTETLDKYCYRDHDFSSNFQFFYFLFDFPTFRLVFDYLFFRVLFFNQSFDNHIVENGQKIFNNIAIAILIIFIAIIITQTVPSLF